MFWVMYSLITRLDHINKTVSTNVRLKKVDCYSDPLVCVDPICKLTPLRRYFKDGIYGCTPVQPAHKLWVIAEH
jgi:hypothetical protein